MDAEFSTASTTPGFRHEALFYSGKDALVSSASPFVEDAIDRNEPILLALGERKIAAFTARFGTHNPSVAFVDLDRVGANPGLIISIWQDFVSEHGNNSRRMRGIGEPITASLRRAVLVEGHHHESLLNLAFEDVGHFWLLCPYDVDALSAAVLQRIFGTHPYVNQDGVTSVSRDFQMSKLTDSVLGDPLPDPPPGAQQCDFVKSDLTSLRSWLSSRALEAGLSTERSEDLVLAAHEIASNSVIHGGGSGRLLVWREESSVVCQITDSGAIRDPLVGRLRPGFKGSSGRGLWLVNHLIDLMQIRSASGETEVRLHQLIH